MQIEVLIPCAEAEFSPAALERCVGPASGCRIAVLANGALRKSSHAMLERAGVVVHRNESPRGARLREAARKSRADALCFLHADTRLPAGWSREIERLLSRGSVWGAFRLSFEDDREQTRIPLVALGANVRSRLLALPYGDQAPFVLRETYEAVDGHPPWPFLEDLELSRRLRRCGKPALSPLHVRSSARRYLEHGAFRTVRRHCRILLRHSFGQSPESLYQLFRR